MTSPETTPRSRGLAWAGMAVAVVFLYLFLRGRDWSSIMLRVQQAHLGWLLLGLFTQVLLYGLKAVRWGLLFPAPVPSMISRWHATTLGFAANVVLPGRLGEALRVAAIHRLGKVELGVGVSSVVLERILDLAALGCLLGIGAQGMGSDNPSLALMRLVGLGVTAVTLAIPPILFFLLGRGEEKTRPWLEWISNWFPERFRDLAMRFLLGLSQGFTVIDSLASLFLVFLVSLIHWGLGVITIWVVAKSLGLSLSFSGGAVVLGAVAFAVALPQAPGFVGTYHWATAETLALLGQPTEQAAACAILFWLVGVIPSVLLGFLSLLAVGRGETREMLG